MYYSFIHRKMSFIVFIYFAITSLSISLFAQKDPKMLVEKMVAACGGTEAFYSMADVQYEYIYQDLATQKKDVSIERYTFDGERSWAKFTTRDNTMAPDLKGEMIQGYNGKTSWVTVDGKQVEDPKLLNIVDFLRKTNYYWFAMMFKLLDPGVNYEYLGTRQSNNINYDLVKITFGENTGDVQDTYVLYINPETNLVDQFLFTVLDFKITEPNLMVVEYETVDGLKLPTKRKYAPATWEGEVKKDRWTAEICKNIKFGNSFSHSLYQVPGKGQSE